MFQKVLTNGCALVPKSESGDRNYWRYSFSEAEGILISQIPRATLKAFLALKVGES